LTLQIAIYKLRNINHEYNMKISTTKYK